MNPSIAEPAGLDESLLEAASEMIEQQAQTSAFALTDDHEFKVPELPKPEPIEPPQARANHIPIEVYGPVQYADTTPRPPSSAPPGSPESPYRRCSCLAVMPGRVCMRCHGTKWLKSCPKCEGDGRVTLNKRKGAERSEPCGFCMGTGQIAASRSEIRTAEMLAAQATPIAPESPAEPVQAPLRRAARLPAIGATEHKKKVKRGPKPRKAKT